MNLVAISHVAMKNVTLRSRVTRIVVSFGLGLAALAAGAPGALAQQTTIAVPGGYVTFTPAQRDYAGAYVLRHPVPPAPVPGGFVAAVGSVVPAGVPLQRFEPGPAYEGTYGAADYDPDVGAAGYADPGYDFSQYRYAVTPGNAVVVEPRSRRIILVIE